MEPEDNVPAEMASEEGSSTGLDPNLAGLLTYLLGFLTGLLFLILEKKDSYVRFHAMQSTLTFLGLFVLNIVSGFIPFLGGLIRLVATLGGVVIWILLMIKAFQGERYELPIVGEVAAERTRTSG